MANTMTPQQARTHALHYGRHVSEGWDGYSMDDAFEYATGWMADFLTGGLTVEADLLPMCDEYCA